MTTTPVLALPNFSLPFELETDASGTGIGSVLMQGGRPLSYMSKQLSPKHQSLSIYEREFLAILMSVQRWRHYLQGHKFVIRTDQQALKHILDQKIVTPLQQKWVVKLLGFNYEVHYKKGRDNKVADALSRRGEALENCAAISTMIPTWMQQVHSSYEGDVWVQKILERKALQSEDLTDWQVHGNILRYKNKIVIGKATDLRKKLLWEMHNSSFGGHSGVRGSYERLRRLFYWHSLKSDVLEWVRRCDICSRTKPDNGPYPGLLQPLPIPEQAWTHISMDFIEGLPKSNGKDVILVVVDRLTKYAHFIPLSHPFTAQVVAKLFLDQIYKLHGVPVSIVSDRDKVFTSHFWRELFKTLGTSLDMSSAYHPQSDGQTERLNRCLENYLRAMVHQNPKLWLKWLTLAEFWYNTSFHSSLNTTPFEALYGYPPPLYSPVGHLPSPTTDATDIVKERRERMQELRENLRIAQNRMKQYADKHRQEREFQVGDYVYLKLQPFRQNSVCLRRNLKLAAKYYGPYKVLEKIGKVAYRLDMPDNSRIHPVFHVSLLKKFLSSDVIPLTELPISDQDGIFVVAPSSAVAERVIERQGRHIRQIQVLWGSKDAQLSTWEDLGFLRKKFPKFNPWGQGSLKTEGIVVNKLAISVGIDEGESSSSQEEESCRLEKQGGR